MKLIAVKMVVAGLILSATPALAAPPEIEDFCFAQLEQVRPPLSSTAEATGKHFIANCIADLTPYPPAKRRPYKKRGY